MEQITLTWAELTAAYEAMLRECSNSEEHTARRWIGFAQSMTDLIPRIRNLSDLDDVWKWLSHDNLVIKIPDRELRLNILYDDPLYVFQLYRNGELWKDTQVTSGEAVNELRNQIQIMRDLTQ